MNMKFTDLPPVLQEYLMTWNALRNLAFKPDHIYLAIYQGKDPSGSSVVACELQYEGGTWSREVGVWEGTTDELRRLYDDVAPDALQSTEYEQKWQVWKKRPENHGSLFAISVVTAGITPPLWRGERP